MGADVASITGDQYGCGWITAAGSVQAHVSTSITLDVAKSSWPNGADIPVGGHAAYYAKDADRLWVDLGGRVLTVQLVGADVTDEQAVLSSLADSALTALATSSPPPAPLASIPPATGLLAMFPPTIGGKPLGAQLVPADQVATLFAANTPATLAFLDGLTAQGKSDVDVEEAVGIAGDGSVIIALRVTGADATTPAPLFAALLTGLGPPPATETIAGRGVSTVQGTAGKPSVHVYASGDTIWAVQAVDPSLTEILTALP